METKVSHCFLLLFLLLPSFNLAFKGPVTPGCENEWPCEPDYFCSKYQRRCRPCELIVGYCSNRTYILDNIDECDAFCVRYLYEQKLNDLSQQLENRTAELQKAVHHPQTDQDKGDLYWYNYLLPVVTFMAGVLISALVACFTKRAQKGSNQGHESQRDETIPLTEPSQKNENVNTEADASAFSDYNGDVDTRFHPHVPCQDTNPIEPVHGQPTTEGAASENSIAIL